MKKNDLSQLKIHESWWDDFFPLFQDGTMDLILEKLGNSIIPTRQNVFKAFSVPKEKVVLVVMGQDPYPSPKLANGIAFATPATEDSESLKIIRNTFYLEYGEFFIDNYFDNTMQYWMDNGVLLLNASLTTRPYKSAEHIEIWKPFMEKMVTWLDENVVWILMGKSAKYYKNFIRSKKIINTVHPMADVYGSKTDFQKSKVFTTADKLLDKPFNWYDTSKTIVDKLNNLPF